MAVPPVIAVKAAQSAQAKASSALTHDLYVKRWTSTKGKGKKKKVVEHELHINPVAVAILGGAATLGVAALGLGLWLSGNKAKLGGTKTVKRIVDEYQPVMETVTVVDAPAVAGHYESHLVPIGRGKSGYVQVWVAGMDAMTHTEQRTKTAAKTVVMTNRFVPRGSYGTFDDAVVKMQARYKNPMELKETSLVWVSLNGRPILRHFMEFTADGAIGIEGRKGFLE